MTSHLCWLSSFYFTDKLNPAEVAGAVVGGICGFIVLVLVIAICVILQLKSRARRKHEVTKTFSDCIPFIPVNIAPGGPRILFNPWLPRSNFTLSPPTVGPYSIGFRLQVLRIPPGFYYLPLLQSRGGFSQEYAHLLG